MVLAQWLERGLGQIFAPDPSYNSQADIIDTASSLWQTVAPDPNFSPEKKASSAAAAAAATPPPLHAFRQEQQQHAFSTPSSSSSSLGGGGNGNEMPAMSTPMSTGKITCPEDIPQQLKEEMLKAAIDTAAMAKRNGKYQKDAKKLLACASQKRPPNAKTKEELIQLLQNDLQQYKEHAKLLLEEGGTGEVQPPLYEARSINAGASCPDGLTPLQAAARSGAIEVAQMLLQLDDRDDNGKKTILRCQLQRTNYFGQTAKHLAAEFHREDMVDLIQQYQQSLNPQQQEDSIDVMGRTPWAMVMTSPVPKGKNSTNLKNKLFSPQDPSFLGSPTPQKASSVLLRTFVYPNIHTVHATAHLNGMRAVDNEDALFATTWQYTDNNSSTPGGECCPVGFFIVCDGHDDRGTISEHVVKKLPQLLREGMDSSFSSSHDDWTRLCATACSTIDLELKKLGWQGGTTAIFCLVTKDQIVVGNVGDSRCILVEHKPTNSTTTTSDNVGDEGKASAVAASAGQESGDSTVENLAESMNQQLSLSGTDGSPAVASPPSESPLLAVTVTGGGTMTVVATALSEDHKANLPDERARVEKAGLEVIELKCQDQHGNEATRFKVKLKEGNNMVDFTRSLGDHDYKSIKGLADHEQPIVCIPDVRIIDRHAIAPESYLVLACDGVWDVKSNDDVANFVTENIHRRLAENATEDEDILSNVGDDLLLDCVDSNDNLSTIIVALSQAADVMVASSRRLRRRHSNSAMKTPPSPVINSAFTTPQK